MEKILYKGDREMERIQITMGNGEKFITKWESIEELEADTTNDLGIIFNAFIEIDDGIYINPSHISNVELTKV